jgi:iron complex transport system substrate-binding protein
VLAKTITDISILGAHKPSKSNGRCFVGKVAFFLLFLALNLIPGVLAQPFTVTDSRGQAITVRSVERIVSIDGATTEILFALGMGHRVVGHDTSSI